MIKRVLYTGLVCAVMAGCDPTTTEPDGNDWACVLAEEEDPDFSNSVGCLEDFYALASLPLDASIPGAQSVKTVIDRLDGNAIYFQNSERYQIHWEFTFEHLSGNGLPLVPDLGNFNITEYYSPSRRFLLGAVTYYEEADVWAYEISPYDTATADMIAEAYHLIQENAFFGVDLFFHPTSQSVEAEAANLPDTVQIITTDELFEGITYQPLNLATSMGLLSFYTNEEFEGAYLNYREIVVLESVPNDISIVSGIVTNTFQTPLAHINVLSQNRGTPNMALIGAMEDEGFRALEGKWIELVVGAFEYSIREVTQEEADAWWEANSPDPVVTNPMDLTVTDLRDTEDILDLENLSLSDAITAAVPAFGGKATHYGGLVHIGEDVPHPKAFAIPVYYYNQFMEENDFWPVAEAMLEDDDFQNDPAARHQQLLALQELMLEGAVNQDFLDTLIEKHNAEYGVRTRFRSSTNAEDVSGFNGAGLYTSKSGDPNDPDYPIEDAVRTVWSSCWSRRAFEEREYYGINHLDIGMALLVHRSFPDEEANGVAITANVYDTTGLEPGFYINVQAGGESVVLPIAGVTSDQFIYYFGLPGQPISFIAQSNLVPEGETVLTNAQTYALGVALKAIHEYFYEAYGDQSFYGMDVEFKFDGEPGEEPQLYVKQARPYPGWGAQ